MKLEDLLPLAVKDSPPQDEDEYEKAESKTGNASVEGAENVEDAADEILEKETTGGKKKGTRKKRSLNWEEAERGLLLEVIKSKVEFVENRSVDAKSIKAKRLAWTQITKQFNALNFRHRLLEQIQVQWRSMKNSAKREHQQKHPKSEALDGMRMIDFMEEMQKEPVLSRSHTRSAGAGTIKKELVEIDEDEDMPLAALPNSTNGSDDTLQTSTIAIPSPPPSTAGGDSQQETCQQSTPPRNRKKAKQEKIEIPKDNGARVEVNTPQRGRKRQRQRKVSSQTHVTSDDTNTETAPLQLSSTVVSGAASTVVTTTDSSCTNTNDDSKYKIEIFKIIKQARLAEMDYLRREHEQKLRFEKMEQELKMRQLREEHELRMRHQQAEHEARLAVYAFSDNRPRNNAVKHNNDSGENGASPTVPAAIDGIGGAAASVAVGHN